jgi:hypothetical protein
VSTRLRAAASCQSLPAAPPSAASWVRKLGSQHHCSATAGRACSDCTSVASRRVACTGGWDWLATWAHLGGVDDVTDHKAAAAGLPPVDSLSEPVLACMPHVDLLLHPRRAAPTAPARLACVCSLRSDSVAAQRH